MEFVPHGMAPSPPGAAPLRVQAAAAASLLAEGVLPEDVGAAAGLANPKGGEYTPRVLADLADAIRAAAVSAAISSVGTEVGDVGDGDGGTQPGRNAHAAWSPGGDVGVADYRDSTNAAWWDPESLATLLCATHRADGALQSLDGFDLATVVDALVTHHEWSIHDVGDLLWCIHTAQTVDTTVKNNTHNVTMARVTELADVAIDLSRRESLVHGGFGWSKRGTRWGFPKSRTTVYRPSLSALLVMRVVVYTTFRNTYQYWQLLRTVYSHKSRSRLTLSFVYRKTFASCSRARYPRRTGTGAGFPG
mgnify:CR=1 FL=1|jgi:hypothetical protein|tara:strand:+ start:3651 stop:4565 length:915 start_codon:yes stop_codon:yes gene_type:complete